MQKYVIFATTKKKKIQKKVTKDKNYQKVRDHCHCTDKYRDIGLTICNLNLTRLMKSQWVFITVEIMINILSLKN